MKILRIPLLTSILLPLFSVTAYTQPPASIYQGWVNGFTSGLQHTHDMALPAWGPYSGKYNGISHVPVQNNGFRFDVAVQPSLYLRNQTVLANPLRESGYHPWQASPDLSYYSYRYQLEWKDKVFCDVSFSQVDDNSRLIKAAFVNNTTANRCLALNLFSTIIFPYNKRVSAHLPGRTQWLKAADYSSKTDAVMAHNYNLVYNGQLRGQITDDNAVSHTAIVLGKTAGEKLQYHFTGNSAFANAVLLVRYRTGGAGATTLSAVLNGSMLAPVVVNPAKEYTLLTLPLGVLAAGDIDFSMQTTGGNALILDGFALAENNEAASVSFKEDRLNIVPRQITTGMPNAAMLQFDDIKGCYGLLWRNLAAEERVLLDDSPDEALFKFENLVKREGTHKITITGNNKGWFKNVFTAPVVVKPGQTVTEYAFVVYGADENEVKQQLQKLNSKWGEVEVICRSQQERSSVMACNEAGKPYQFSQQLMAATTLTNLMYPTFMGNQYLKHTTPGKKWSSFYTWDAGFIGLGYAALNTGRALECLNAYTMADTEPSAFLEHGTPLPVQAYLFNELWNKTQNKEYLTYFYPRLKRWYRFLGGAESSTTRKLKSGLLQTWDIFYNSGGWDDYCPQVYTHTKKLEKIMAPTINTSHQIRFAKLLRMAAWQLGYKEDIAAYDKDIQMYSHALQQYAWHEASGYFGYVTHDNEGQAKGILTHASGENFNKGLDGCSPLIAGICTPEQQKRITQHLFTRGELWSDQGITAIDQTAPYYNKDGYWNGRVWMPHQWFVWKTMLDMNEPDKAIQIAQTALDVWKRETEDSYNCWENFSVETGNGGGWHQFGALSSPVLNWFSALYKPGTVTHGFDVWPVTQQFSTGNDGFTGSYRLFTHQQAATATLLICLQDQCQYQATCNGKSIPLRKVLNGLYVVQVNATNEEGYTFTLELKKK